MKWLLACAIALTAIPSSAANPEFRLKFAHHNPPGAFLNVYGTDIWAKNIETRTNGRVKIDLYPAQMLGRATDTYDNTINGICDIGWTYLSYQPGRYPLSEVVMLPMLGLDTASIASKVIWDLYANTPYLKKEYEEVKLLTLNTHDGNPIGSTKPILTAADLVGKKLRSAGGPLNPFLQVMGATPMSMPSVDTYQAAEKGVIDGAVLVYEAVQMQNLQEVLKYYLEASVSSGAFALFMNKKVWDSLPPDIQKIFDEESGDKASQLIGKGGCDDHKAELVAAIVKAGGTIKKLDPAEAAKWQEKARPVWDKWASDLEAKGLPGKAVLDYTLKKIEELKKQGY
jgi:TRAP-type C4-dicarboxylate transport system substrate-binding protein